MTSMSLVGLSIFSFSCFVGKWLTLVKKPVIYSSSNSKHDPNDHVHLKTLEEILSECPSLHRAYFPSLFFHNGHLQLIPFTIKGYCHLLLNPPFQWVVEEAILEDGEIVNLAWVGDIPSFSETDESPVLMIHHGAFCDHSDIPGQSYISEALKRGWKVCVWNRRGHLRKLTTPKWNFFGCTNDLRYIMKTYLHRKRPQAPLLMLGLSAGSGLIARYMGEQGLLLDGKKEMMGDEEYRKYLDEIGFCTAAVGMAPGYDIEKCMGRFGAPYSTFLLEKGKEFFIQDNTELLKDCPGYKECLEAQDLQTWLDHSYGMAGFASREEYFASTNPMNVVPHIRQPTLMLNAADDPLCLIENLEEQLHIFEAEHPVGAAVVVTATGSHCPFYEIGLSSWSERVSFEFFDAAIAK